MFCYFLTKKKFSKRKVSSTFFQKNNFFSLFLPDRVDKLYLFFLYNINKSFESSITSFKSPEYHFLFILFLFYFYCETEKSISSARNFESGYNNVQCVHKP